MSGVLNLAGALAGTAVAATVAKGIVATTKVTQDLVLAALLAAIVWDLITFYAALPTSSSHALIFGIIGAAVSVHGDDLVPQPADLGWSVAGRDRDEPLPHRVQGLVAQPGA